MKHHHMMIPTILLKKAHGKLVVCHVLFIQLID
ncbi:hypothetical protein E9U_04790 [Moraxella catarrhalis BC8]|nr:hypothetical protein E9U_04790 [Moraxella catarrhalis BC8]EGE26253.1 hypothetical protein EA1_05292 [Moraxella catarrhalis O35E]